jgi:hypothetical protein
MKESCCLTFKKQVVHIVTTVLSRANADYYWTHIFKSKLSPEIGFLTRSAGTWNMYNSELWENVAVYTVLVWHDDASSSQRIVVVYVVTPYGSPRGGYRSWGRIHLPPAIHQWLHIPFLGPWPLFQFHNPIHTVSRTPWTGDQPVARPLPRCRTLQIQNKRTQTSLALVGFDPTTPMFKRVKTVYALYRPVTVFPSFYFLKMEPVFLRNIGTPLTKLHDVKKTTVWILFVEISDYVIYISSSLYKFVEVPPSLWDVCCAWTG